ESGIFEVASGSTTLTTLAHFSAATGSDTTGVVLDNSGNLLGTTSNGGGHGDGTAFELSKGSKSIHVIASFPTFSEPSALTIDSAGNIYGTTRHGGSYAQGTVFEIANGSRVIQTLATFTFMPSDSGFPDITAPQGPLAIDAAGNLYGTAANTSQSEEEVFEVLKGSGTITVLATILSPSSSPTGYLLNGVVLDATGNLYGASTAGGTFNDGFIYEVAKDSGTITTLATFNGANGETPNGLVIDPAGN